MNCLVNENGELLEILQEEREPQTREHIVPLDGYYEVFNTQLYSQAVWDFTEKKWKGVGDPNIPPEPLPTEIDILKEKNSTLEKALLEMAEVQSKEYENRIILENAVLDLANTIAGGKRW